MTRKTPHALLSVAALLLLPAAAGSNPAPQASATGPESEAGVVARVNGDPVYLEDLEQLLEQMHSGASSDRRTKPDLERLMFRLVNDALLAQEARTLGMDQEEPIPARLAARREALAAARLESEEVLGKARPTEEEMRQAFAEEYRTVTFRILTVRDREKAGQLIRQLEEGADFDALARARSIDPYGPKGGLVEKLAKIDMPHELASDVFALAPGGLAGPLSTRIGWSAIRVESLAPADPARFESLKPSLHALVRFRKAEALRVALGERLRAAHRITIDDAALAAVVPERLPDGRLMPKVENPEAVVARVGDRTVTAERLGKALGLRWKGVANEEAARAARAIVLDRLVQQELLLAEALARGYGDTPEARRALRAAETQLLVKRYLGQVVAGGVHVEPEEMKAYYEANRESYHRPPRLRLRQITVATEAEAERLAGLLRQGADIAWLARQHSTDGYRDAGGDRGWIVPRETGESFEAALLVAKPGDVLGPTPATEGFSVVQVAGRQEQGLYAYDEVSGNVRKAVEERKSQQALHELIRKLRSRSKIEVYEERVAALRITAAPEGESTPAHGMPPTPEP